MKKNKTDKPQKLQKLQKLEKKAQKKREPKQREPKKGGKRIFATIFTDLLFDLIGCSLFSIGVQCFTAPNKITPGGITGISVLINYVFSLPISIVSFALNIPLLILAFIFLGSRFTLRTLKSVAIMTAMLELATYLPQYTGEPILAALSGGVLGGIGLAMVFMRGSTTGGSDVASRLIQIKLPHVPVGRLILMVDGCVLIAAGIVYQSIESTLYGLIEIFASTMLIDSILYGLDQGKVMLIVSQHAAEIPSAIYRELARGCTILKGRGSYTGAEQDVLMVAMRKNQYFRLKRIVHDADPAAFMVTLDSSEVIGEGFKDVQKSISKTG